uniref:Uncharacterized protein n=1 Tax=Tanacetum cinerariifolium TaxID=118510 RepID=A0A699HSD0_TANCI|nr:hypothetical protein [Tanacetum cinerariifolium]
MFFYLGTLNLARFLNKIEPQVEPPKSASLSSGIDDEVVQDQRQRDDNDHQDERQDQPKVEEVEPKRGVYVRSGCTTALNVVPWETDCESVLKEACLTLAWFTTFLLLSLVIIHRICLLLLPHSRFWPVERYGRAVQLLGGSGAGIFKCFVRITAGRCHDPE